jgi:hypothetical protein
MPNLEVELEIVSAHVVATTSGLPDKQEFMKSGNVGALSLGA